MNAAASSSVRKPIIGIIGGIGSGKSFVARLFGELGCCVIDADVAVRAAYAEPAVIATLRQWWGDAVVRPDGTVDKTAIARMVFADPRQRQRLEGLLHPLVAVDRQRKMAAAENDPAVVAFVWDVPLLLETGLNRQCDRVVFVEAPLQVRLQRLARQRCWSEAELAARENSQLPLDKKRAAAHDVVVNAGEADDEVRRQVREILSRVLQP